MLPRDPTPVGGSDPLLHTTPNAVWNKCPDGISKFGRYQGMWRHFHLEFDEDCNAEFYLDGVRCDLPVGETWQGGGV